MNKYGFTIIELLATVTLILLAGAVLIPGIISISNDIKKTQSDSQIELVLAGAKEWGEDNIELLTNECKNIPISNLIESGYIKGDKKNAGKLLDPATNKDISETEICVKYVEYEDGEGKKYYKVTASIEALE